MDYGSDNSIMLQVKAGDIDKLSILFERYKKAMYAYFFRLTQNQNMSEDLVQNVFYRILKYRKNYSATGKFKTWIYRIAHNVFIDCYKKEKKRALHEQELPVNYSLTDNAEQHTLNRECINLLEKALYRLNEDKRELIIMSRYSGMKYKEIAQVFNCTEGAVKVRVFRALMELKDTYLKLQG